MMIIKLLSANAVTPTSDGSKYTLLSAHPYTILPQQHRTVDTDIAVSLPTDTHGVIESCYSLVYTGIHSHGVVKENENIRIVVYNNSENILCLHAGDEIASLVIVSVVKGSMCIRMN